MAQKKKTKPARPSLRQRLRRWVRRAVLAVLVLLALVIGGYAILPVPVTPFQMAEARRLGEIDKEWVSLDYISPYMARSAVAAEDANFCDHWGFDMVALRAALAEGGRRGGSTIPQQTVKNVFLWQGRSWPRKALEAVLTPVIELAWSKQRILEIYLNVIEFDEGVFGIQAASRHYFDVDAADLSAVQAARLAAILPNPKQRSASNPSPSVRRRAAQVLDGAATIQRDGRAACFSD